jgi:Fe-S cluster assembly protein SufB
VGELPNYDIEVEGTANFIANGVFVHNSQKTMKYPSIYLRGRGATADIISVAVAGRGQHQDTGAKAIHLAPDTKSRIVSKSVSKDGGRATYRGSLRIAPGATGVVASVRCDALMLDDESRSDTYPYIDVQEDDTTMTHEATVGKISADQIFYLQSRGLTENEAQNLVVQGFLEVFTKELPMEYAIEFNRLVRLEMEGGLG